MLLARIAPFVLVYTLCYPAAAQQLKSEELICKLDPDCPKPKLRDLRGVFVEGGNPEPPLSVDLFVNFAYNSSDLLPDSLTTLDQLGKALADSRLTKFRFLISGHTDARGSEQYNQVLSERRASAVARYLEETHHISHDRLLTKGYGKSRLLDREKPEDGVNRRVQVQNIDAAP